jgi:hypothetical protein
MTAAAKIKHPDAVFGPDDDLLMQLVDRLKVTDVSALSPTAQNQIATAISTAANRLVEDYTSLERDRKQLAEERSQLTSKRIEIETREAAVTARETLLGLHQPPKRRFLLWK